MQFLGQIGTQNIFMFVWSPVLWTLFVCVGKSTSDIFPSQASHPMPLSHVCRGCIFTPAAQRPTGRTIIFLYPERYPDIYTYERGHVFNTGCSLNIVFFLPVLLQRWCSTCLVCVHTLTLREKQRKARVRNIIKSSEKNTIFNEHPVCDTQDIFY